MQGTPKDLQIVATCVPISCTSQPNIVDAATAPAADVVITKALYGVNCPQTNGGADVTSYAQAAVAGQTGSTITWGPIYCA